LVLEVVEFIEGAWISSLLFFMIQSITSLPCIYLYNLNFKMWRMYLVSIVLSTSLILTMLLKMRLNLLYHRQLEECVLVTWVLFFWILYLSFILFHLSHTYFQLLCTSFEKFTFNYFL
jgi:hypothetical protein